MTEEFFLESGVPVILKSLDSANSVSIGVFAKVGLSQEPDECSGIAHFLEHMCFKGTKKRTAKKITVDVDNIGGNINAHTSKEYTCYYLTVLPHHIRKAVDIVSDIYLHSVLSAPDIATEKQVVLEEINMYNDTPDELIHDAFSSLIWEKNKLGRPILGDASSLNHITKEVLESFRAHYKVPQNIVIVAAGKIENKAAIKKLFEKTFVFDASQKTPFSELALQPKSVSKVNLIPKTTEQVHFCLGTQGVPFNAADHYSITLLSTLLGGSMSSRLFQKIREKKGLAYSIYAYASFYKHAGLFTIYAGVSKQNFKQALKLARKELRILQEVKVGAKELQKAKEQLKGNMILSLEKSSTWMHWIGRNYLYLGRFLEVDEVVTRIDEVGAGELLTLAQNIFEPNKATLAAIGPFSEQEMTYNHNRFDTYCDQLRL